MTEIIHTDPERDLEVRRDTQVPPDLLELLSATVWGQHGVIFRSRDMAQMLDDLGDPSFLRLMKGGRTVAAAVRNHKPVTMAGKPFDAVHLALFAVHPAFTRQGLGTVLADVSRRHYLNALQSPGILYGYIETGNEASLRMNLGIGYRELGTVRSRIFSRIRPKPSPRVARIDRAAVPQMLHLLKTTYHDHTLCNFDQSLDPEHYFVLRRKGKIMAGAQLHVLHWELLGLPGWQGRLAMRLLPLLGRAFRPADLRFARVGNIYAARGAEHFVADILETALATQDLPLAAVLVDKGGAPERRILNAIDFGLLDRTISGGFHMVGEFKGVEADEIDALSRAPVIISPRDPL